MSEDQEETGEIGDEYLGTKRMSSSEESKSGTLTSKIEAFRVFFIVLLVVGVLLLLRVLFIKLGFSAEGGDM